MADLSIRLFGPVSILASTTDDKGKQEKVVKLEQSAQMLLCWLALYAPDPVPRDVVMAGLWPDVDPDRARSRLSTALWRLKKALAEAGVAGVICDAGIGLTPAASETVDARLFEAAARIYLSDPSAASWETLEGLRTRGPLLAGCYAVWALSARVRLDDLWERCLAARLERGLEQGDHAAVQMAATELLEIDPLDEDAHRALISMYLTQGRRGHALRQYQRCAEALHRDLGVAPAAETQVLTAEFGQCAGAAKAPRTPRASDLQDLRRMLAQTQTTLMRLSERLDGLL